MTTEQVKQAENLCFLIEACNTAIYSEATTARHKRAFKKLRSEYREKLKAIKAATTD